MTDTWLPFVGTVVAALTAGVVALVIDARRRADAERVRLDTARVTAYATVLEAALGAWSAIRRARKLGDDVPLSGGAIDRFSVAIFSAQILSTPDTIEALQGLRSAVIDRYRAVKEARENGDEEALRTALDGFSGSYGRARDKFAAAANAELTHAGRPSVWTRAMRSLWAGD